MGLEVLCSHSQSELQWSIYVHGKGSFFELWGTNYWVPNSSISAQRNGLMRIFETLRGFVHTCVYLDAGCVQCCFNHFYFIAFFNDVKFQVTFNFFRQQSCFPEFCISCKGRRFIREVLKQSLHRKNLLSTLKSSFSVRDHSYNFFAIPKMSIQQIKISGYLVHFLFFLDWLEEEFCC